MTERNALCDELVAYVVVFDNAAVRLPLDVPAIIFSGAASHALLDALTRMVVSIPRRHPVILDRRRPIVRSPRQRHTPARHQIAVRIVLVDAEWRVHRL